MSLDKPAPDGFTKVVNRRRNHKKSITNPRVHPASSSKPSTSNNFATLASNDIHELENPPLSEKETTKEKQKEALPLTKESQINKLLPHTQINIPDWNFQGMEVDNTTPAQE